MTKYSADRIDAAEATELSMGFGMVVAIGLLLGTLAMRHIGVPFSHLAHYAQTAVTGLVG